MIVAVFLAVFGPAIAPYGPTTATLDALQSPNRDHWFGTDANGFDVFSRTIAAPRYDVTIALVGTVVSFVLGTAIGLGSCFSHRAIGESLVGISDSVQAFPLFVLAIIFVIGAGRSPTNIVIVIALLNTPIFFRLARAEGLSLCERPFVEAARAAGASPFRVMMRHVLPNALSPAFAQISITMGYSILVAAGLSFLGAGVQPPAAEWGSMIAAGAGEIINGYWWISIFPGSAMAITVFGFAIIGELAQKIVMRRR